MGKLSINSRCLKKVCQFADELVSGVLCVEFSFAS